jgi:predicted nucleic acid-binding protein
MKYVLDASVGVQCLLVETDTVKARQLRDDFNTGSIELLAPDVFPVEVLNVLTKAERKGRITPQDGEILAETCLNSLPILHDSLSLLPRAYELSSATRSAVYNCLYVALAEREGCDLVTADKSW